jgi:YD repeat-containing protein
MNRIILILALLTFGSCSLNKKNDLESMNLNGKVRAINEKRFSSNDSLEVEIHYVFDNSGQLVSSTHYYPSSQVNYKTTNHYNFWGRLTEQKFFESDSLVLKQVFIKIDNTKDSLLAYDSKGDLVNIGILKYNEDRKVTESLLHDTSNKVTYSESSPYDTIGKLTENKISSPDSTINGTVYKYSYDSLGRIQSFTVYNSTTDYREKEIYSYKTGLLDNWIRKNIETENGDQLGFVTREIKY